MLHFSVKGRQNSYVTVCRWIFRATEILLGPKHLCHNLMTKKKKKKKKKRRRSKLICWVARTYAWLSLFACIIFFSYKFSPQIKKQSRCEIIYKRTKKYCLNQIGSVPVTLSCLEKGPPGPGKLLHYCSYWYGGQCCLSMCIKYGL